MILSVNVNGSVEELTVSYSPVLVIDFLKALNHQDAKGIAVCVNGEIVLKNDWNSVFIQDGDSVLILKAVQGG